MSDLPSDLDLKFLPDWLKESPTENRYAQYEGDTRERGRGPGTRPSGGSRPGGNRPGGDRPGGNRPGGDRNGPGRDQRGGGPGRDARGGRRDDRGGARGGARRPEERRPVSAPAPVAPPTAMVKVDFLPEPGGVAGITKQIRGGVRAYPLFGTARLFLEKPERHRVRITSLNAAIPLFQVGDGPVGFDRVALERQAFQHLRLDFYQEEVVQTEPIKGNFSNVARCRSSGMWLGPTNYHSYQPTLRKLYEERYSRRMSFAEFQQEEIVIINDEQAINDWKEQARTQATFVTLKETEPKTFKTLAEAEAHFRTTYLPGLVKTAVSLETSGTASRATQERAILSGLREAWERERGFPGSLIHHLRPRFAEAGLHFFKHRKRVLYVSPIRPQRHEVGQLFSEGISAILGAIESQPKLNRPQLAAKILGEQSESEECVSKKAALAGDLHYLVQAGHVIEFHDGTLDLPLLPRSENDSNPSTEGGEDAQAKSGTDPVSSVNPAAMDPSAGESATDVATEVPVPAEILPSSAPAPEIVVEEAPAIEAVTESRSAIPNEEPDPQTVAIGSPVPSESV